MCFGSFDASITGPPNGGSGANITSSEETPIEVLYRDKAELGFDVRHVVANMSSVWVKEGNVTTSCEIIFQSSHWSTLYTGLKPGEVCLLLGQSAPKGCELPLMCRVADRCGATLASFDEVRDVLLKRTDLPLQLDYGTGPVVPNLPG